MTDIKYAGLNARNWFMLAADKGQWDEFIGREDIHIPSSANPLGLPQAPASQELRRSSRIAAQAATSTLARRPLS